MNHAQLVNALGGLRFTMYCLLGLALMNLLENDPWLSLRQRIYIENMLMAAPFIAYMLIVAQAIGENLGKH